MFEPIHVAIIVVVVALIAGYIGWHLAHFKLINQMINSLDDDELKELTERLEKIEADIDGMTEEPSKPTIKTLTFDRHNGYIYLYDDGRFLSQGASVELAVKQASIKEPRFIVTDREGNHVQEFPVK